MPIKFAKKTRVLVSKAVDNARLPERRDGLIHLRNKLGDASKTFYAQGGDPRKAPPNLIEALEQVYTITNNPDLEPGSKVSIKQQIPTALGLLTTLIKTPTLYEMFSPPAKKALDNTAGISPSKPVEEAQETVAYETNLKQTSQELLEMLENPESFGLEKSPATTQKLLAAAHLLTEDPNLDPKTKANLETKLKAAKETLTSIAEAPKFDLLLPEDQHKLATQINDVATATPENQPQTTQNLLTTISIPPPPPPPPPTTAPPPAPALTTAISRKTAQKGIEKIAQKFGGTYAKALITAKRILSNRSPKDIAKLGILAGGFLLGGPFGAGLILILYSRKFRIALGVITLAALNAALVAAVVTIGTAAIIAPFVLLIIQNSAYIIPPGDRILLEGESGPRDEDITPGPGGKYPKCWPTFGQISQGPSTYHSTYGDAIDIAGRTGTPIYATHDGTATAYHFSKTEDTDLWRYGYYVVVKSPLGFETRYAHLDGNIFTGSIEVTAGTLIGYMDNTGDSTGTHLHYELRPKSLDINQYVPPYTINGFTEGPPNGCFANQEGGGS